MEEMQTGHVMVTKAYAADAAARGIIYPPDWVLDDDQAGENEARPASTDGDTDAVMAWVHKNPDADLFAIIVAENIVDDDPDWVDDEWTLERVERALRTLADDGKLVTNDITYSAGIHYRLPVPQHTYRVPTRQTIMRTYVVTAESHEEAKAMVQSMVDNWDDDDRADMNVEDLSDERLCGGSERMED